MKIEILEKKDNPLLKRTEVVTGINFEGKATPKKLDVQQEVAKMLKTEAEKVEVLKLITNFGKSYGKAWINSWEEVPEHLKKKEKKPKEEKKGE